LCGLVLLWKRYRAKVVSIIRLFSFLISYEKTYTFLAVPLTWHVAKYLGHQMYLHRVFTWNLYTLFETLARVVILVTSFQNYTYGCLNCAVL